MHFHDCLVDSVEELLRLLLLRLHQQRYVEITLQRNYAHCKEKINVLETF